jgi:hypothetical protein
MTAVEARAQKLADRLSRLEAACRAAMDEIHGITEELERVLLRHLDPIINALDNVAEREAVLAEHRRKGLLDLGDLFVRSDFYAQMFTAGNPSGTRFSTHLTDRTKRDESYDDLPDWYNYPR